MPGRNQRTGSKRLETIIAQLAVAEAITEELKAVNPMARVGAMDSIRRRFGGKAIAYGESSGETVYDPNEEEEQ